MKGTDKYDVSFFGEFMDKALEREFLHYDMKFYSRFIGPVAVIFGIIYMLFIASDYYAVKNPTSFLVIFIIRVLFLIVSASMYFAVKKINDYSNMIYLVTAYEVWAICSFMLIINQYKSISFISFFSMIVITSAIYITPNRLIFAQAISVLFILSFFLFSADHVNNITAVTLFKVVGYMLVLVIFSNIGAYMANFYRRKQFADSRELLKLSTTDSLTGIFNRVRFDQELEWWIDYCSRYEIALSLVILDIDDFKQVNDNHGHLTGDSVLQNITSIIKKAIRNTDIFARWGGEEFVILLPNTDIHQAMEMTERLRVNINENKYDKVENVTCSFGLVSLRKNENAVSLLQRADKLLYRAKEQGKNTVSSEIGNHASLGL